MKRALIAIGLVIGISIPVMAQEVVYEKIDADTLKKVTTEVTEETYKLSNLLREEAEILEAIDRTDKQHISDIEKKQAELLEIRTLKRQVETETPVEPIA